ncbi:hypothetical protein AB1096_001268 [Proteus mirabilis]|nr:hypothetical protein [Proteus mirabilis]EKV9968289.1 hypothetical protein [Proteus mirabilis]MCU9572628.1 hypothetical protein [Proteus mirabilis]MDU1382977.1 hypothetical protein [Proteus mirabilis]HCQ8187775.1 hypothetical protein [Proteus mirabilis]HEK0777907.1 hypothetical protein [Proteus mirabilis]
MTKRNNALESMKKWMDAIPQCLQLQGKQIDNEEPKEKPAAQKRRARK